MTEIANIQLMHFFNSSEKKELVSQLSVQGLVNSKVALGFVWIPNELIFRVEQRIRKLVKNNGKAKAKRFIESLVNFCASFKLNTALSEAKVIKIAFDCSDIFSTLVSELVANNESDKFIKLILDKELASFEVPKRNGKSVSGDIARYCAPAWWKRKLKTIHRRNFEHVAQFIGQVNEQRNIYISDHSLKKINNGKKANEKFINTLLAINEEGEQFDFHDFVDSSLSNPKNKYAELLMRMFGTATYANNKGYKAHLFTILCPKEMKSSFQYGEMNDDYIKESTLAAHHFINKVWKNSRTAIDKLTKNFFGFRVVEPCHDGSPHWHLIVYTPVQETNSILNLLRKKIEQKYDFKGEMFSCVLNVQEVENKDVKNVIFYLVKSLEGKASSSSCSKDMINDLSVNKTDETEEKENNKQRIFAWGSLWGIRQFQQFGMPPIGLWREARRIANKAGMDVSGIWKFSKEGDWPAFIESIGGIGCKKNELTVKLHKVNTYECDCYGDELGKVPLGLEINGEIFISRFHQWKIITKKTNVISYQ
jgi:hypothetical protein